METIPPATENKIDLAHLEFLEYKRFQALREQGIALDNLDSLLLLGHIPAYARSQQ